MLCDLIEQANNLGLISSISNSFREDLKRAQKVLGIGQSSLATLNSSRISSGYSYAPRKLIESGKVKIYRKLKTTYGHMAIEGGLQRPEEITCVCFEYTGNSLYTGSEDGLIKHWYGLTGQLLRSTNCFNPVTTIGISPDNKYLITGTCIGELRIWIREGLIKLCTLSLANAPVNCIRWWYMEEELYVIVCADTLTYIYSISEIQEKLGLAQFTCINTSTEAIVLSINKQGILAIGLLSGEVSLWKLRKDKRRIKSQYLHTLKDNDKKSYFVEWSPIDSL